jgi:hypothetical protein
LQRIFVCYHRDEEEEDNRGQNKIKTTHHQPLEPIVSPKSFPVRIFLEYKKQKQLLSSNKTNKTTKEEETEEASVSLAVKQHWIATIMSRDPKRKRDVLDFDEKYNSTSETVKSSSSSSSWFSPKRSPMFKHKKQTAASTAAVGKEEEQQSLQSSLLQSLSSSSQQSLSTTTLKSPYTRSMTVLFHFSCVSLYPIAPSHLSWLPYVSTGAPRCSLGWRRCSLEVDRRKFCLGSCVTTSCWEKDVAFQALKEKYEVALRGGFTGRELKHGKSKKKKSVAECDETDCDDRK